MFPPVLFTVITPSATSHFAGDLSRFVTHSSRFLPSNSTIASEGAAPQVAPGVTTGGTGSQISVSSGFGLAGDCANSGAAKAISAADARRLENGKRIIPRKYTQSRQSGQDRTLHLLVVIQAERNPGHSPYIFVTKDTGFRVCVRTANALYQGPTL